MYDFHEQRILVMKPTESSCTVCTDWLHVLAAMAAAH